MSKKYSSADNIPEPELPYHPSYSQHLCRPQKSGIRNKNLHLRADARSCVRDTVTIRQLMTMARNGYDQAVLTYLALSRNAINRLRVVFIERDSRKVRKATNATQKQTALLLHRCNKPRLQNKPLLFFKWRRETSVDFNSFWQTTSRKNLTQVTVYFAHLTLMLSLHYLLKCRSRSLAVYNNAFILGGACVGSEDYCETTKSLKCCYLFSIIASRFVLPDMRKVCSRSLPETPQSHICQCLKASSQVLCASNLNAEIL